MRSIVELVVSSSSSGSKIGALPVDHFMVKLYLESFSLIRSTPEFSMLCIAFMYTSSRGLWSVCISKFSQVEITLLACIQDG